MEKQLLGLLDWDLNVTEADLFTHFEPFLAPIRSWQAQEAEKRIREERAAIEQQQLELAQRQMRAADMARYTNPTVSDYAQRSYYAASTSSSRTPSLSPPTRSQSASSYSSSSSSTSPASISSTYSCDASESRVQIQSNEPAVVHMQPLTKQHMPMSISAIEAQPIRKQKSGNIFTRFLPTMASSRGQAQY
jgi:G1/S-specific cyclin PLC1